MLVEETVAYCDWPKLLTCSFGTRLDECMSFSLEWASLPAMKELVSGSTGVTQSEGLNRLGRSEIIEIESSSAISDKILSVLLAAYLAKASIPPAGDYI